MRPDAPIDNAAYFESVAEGDDPVRLGTVTAAEGAVRLRDQLEKARLAALLDAHLPGRDLRILDLGGGAGRMALWLAPRAASVTVVEASAGLIAAGERAAQAAGASHVRFAQGDVAAAEIEGPYDLILMWGVAAYLDDEALRALAGRCREALAPGGLLILKEPVTTEGPRQYDTRRDAAGEIVYRACFRHVDEYPRLLAEGFTVLAQGPTCAHLIPRGVQGTEGAVAATEGAVGRLLLDRLGPLAVRLDPTLRRVEAVCRGSEALRPLLAPVPVIQAVYALSPRSKTARAPDLSVVFIAYNESECVTPVVQEMIADLDAEGLDFELVLVDDGSADDTLSQMRSLEASDPRVVVISQRNKGIGGALRAGFDGARGRYVTWAPADGQIAPSAIVTLYAARDQGDMVTTVYRHRADPWYRMVISNTLNMMIKAGTGEQARSGGNYLFSRQMWLDFGPRDDDSMMISTAFRHNLKAADRHIAVVEIDARPRYAGRSKVLNPVTIARTAWALAGMGRPR